jgi:RimJ/RimL family protein N-acetyltransferase
LIYWDGCRPQRGKQLACKRARGGVTVVNHETARLDLHAVDEAEARRIHDASPGVGDLWADGYPFVGDLAALGAFLRASERDGEQRPFGYYQIRVRADGRAVGGVGFKGQPVEGAVEIGYGLVESARGHGYALEAVEQLVQIARQAGVTTIRADTELDNVASSVTLQRAGFHQVGADSEILHYEANIVR